MPIVAQNTLRTALEVTLAESEPYGEYFLVELALRMAAYTISAAPIERQAALASLVAGSLADALAHKLQQGMAIRTEWNVNGVSHPNVPEPGKTN